MKKILFLTMLVSLVFLGSFQQVFAIGMMTEPIVIKDMLRGQETLVTLTLLNSEKKEVVYGLKAEGQIAKWAHFYAVDDKALKNPITQITMPMADFADVTMKLTVPRDIPNGKYTGTILAFLASGGEVKNDQTSVNISQQVGRSVAITVTDKEIVKVNAAFIPAVYEVPQGDPLTIRVLYNNQGNIEVKPNVQLKITKEGATVYNVIFPYPEGEEPAKAYANREISPLQWQTTGQDNGNYNAELKVFLNDKEIQSESFDFSIGDSKKSFLAALPFFGNNNIVMEWFFVGVILILLVVGLAMIRKKGISTIGKK